MLQTKNRRVREGHPPIRVVVSLWRRRSLGPFFLTFARFHFDIRGGHCVVDRYFIALFDVPAGLGVGIPRNFETLLFRAFLDHDHGVAYLRDRTGYLIILNAGYRHRAAKCESNCRDQTEYGGFHR